MYTSELRTRLNRLHLERESHVKSVGLGGNEAYMTDLENEISEMRAGLRRGGGHRDRDRPGRAVRTPAWLGAQRRRNVAL